MLRVITRLFFLNLGIEWDVSLGVLIAEVLWVVIQLVARNNRLAKHF
jgi:hypothetical protein